MSRHRQICIVLGLLIGLAAGYAFYVLISAQNREGTLRFADALGPNTIAIASVLIAVLVAVLIARLRPFGK